MDFFRIYSYVDRYINVGTKTPVYRHIGIICIGIIR